MKPPTAAFVGATHARGTRTRESSTARSFTARTFTDSETEASVVPAQHGEPLDAFTAWERSTHSP
ncbi:MAG: hypothetical protein VX616_02610, partial [Actinomycetota bacterium]|nr:hypothetical protein [Actinomycetota bacterium]